MVKISKSGKRWRWKYVDPSTKKALAVSPSGWTRQDDAVDAYERMAKLICAEHIGPNWQKTLNIVLLAALVVCVIFWVALLY